MATDLELGITEPGFTDWGAVVDSPEYQNATIDNRLGAFQNWSDYSKNYFQKRLEEAPENAKSGVEEKLRKLETYTSRKSDFLRNQYDLPYQVSKLETSEDIISALGDPEKLRQKGFTDEVIFGLRKEVEKEYAPMLANARAGTESVAEAGELLWEEAGLTDIVANFANRVLPVIATQALRFVEGVGNLAEMFPTDSSVYAPDYDTQLPFKETGRMAKTGSEFINTQFPNDPRLSSDVIAATEGLAQAPFSLATAALGTVPNAFINYSQMYQENLDTYAPQITKRRYEEEIKSGVTSRSTPFKQWESLLSDNDKKDIKAEAATKAMLFAVPQAAIETFADRFLLKSVPLPASVKSKLMSWRNTRPAAYIGARVATNFLAKTGVESGTEVGQQAIGNVGGAINTGNFDTFTKGFRESAIGGAFGGAGAAALTLPNTFRTEQAIDWAQSITSGLEEAAQRDIAIIKDPNANKNSPEYKAAIDRASKKERSDYEHQFDLAFVNDPNVDKNSVEYRNAQKSIQAREDEANWVLTRVGDARADKEKAARYEAVSGARKNFETALTKHIRRNEPDFISPNEEFRTRVQEIRTSFSGIRQNAQSLGMNFDVDAAEKLALEQLAAGTSEKAKAAAKLVDDFIGSVDTDGPGRVLFARQEVARMYPNSPFATWWNDDATVVELLNAREAGEIDDDTNPDEWLSSPAGIKATASESKSGANAAKPGGLLTTGQRRDAIFNAKQNAKKSGDPQLQEDFEKLENDLDFWHTALANKDSSEEDKAEARALLPTLEDALLELATAPVEANGLTQTLSNGQNQTPNPASIPSQEVSSTSATDQGTGTRTEEPFTIVRNIAGEEVIQTERDYINESREIVKAFIRGKMSPEQVLGNVESVRREIDAAPDLTPEQKTKWFSSFQNIPSVVEQFGKQDTSPDASASASALTAPETTGSPELIAGEGIISEQPTPVRMNSVPGDVLRTETGEVVFRSATDNTETVLRVKEGSIEKDPAALTFEDFESGDGASLVSETNKQFSVLPNNDRPVRPFFRSQPQQQTEGGETQNEIQQTEPVRQEQQSEPIRQEQQGGSSQEQSSSPQGQSQEVAPETITSQDGQTAKSSGSYPEDAGSTPAPATPAIDTEAITADVQANPDIHRLKDGNRKLVSREAAVAIFTQLPETFTNKDVATLAKDSGMTSPNLRKLAALRGDQNAVASILNGGMDAELGLFDDVILKMRRERAATKTPLNEATPPTTEVSNDTDAEPADPTPAAETTGQGTVDRFVFNLMAAFNETLSKMNASNLNVMGFRALMNTEEGRAEIQRKLAGMAQTSIFAGIRSKGILDPVVEQEMAEKALYGTVFKATPGSPEKITKNVQQDLLNNLAKTGDPFLTTNKDGDTVSYNAWFARGRNLVDRYIKAQNKRDKGTKNSDGEQEATDVENVSPEEPTDNTLDPEKAFKIEQFNKMKADAIRETYDKAAERLAKETGCSLEDARLALLHRISEDAGVQIDPVSLGWKTEGDTSRVKQTLLKAIKSKFPTLLNTLGGDMKKSMASVLRAAEEQDLLSAPVIDLNNLTLESLIEASVYDEIVNGQSHKNAIAEAREKNSTSPLMPLLAKIDRKGVVAAVHSVLNNGKPFANSRDITALTQSDMQKVLDSGVLPARIQETLQALVDLSGDGMALLQNSKNEGWRRWSELLGEQMGNRAPVQVVFNLALDPTVTGQGLWQEDTNTVHISPFLTREKGLMESTLLHEMMHPVWDWKVSAFQRGDLSQLNKKEVAALTELQDLLGLVKAEADKKLAGITDKAALEIAKRDLLGSSGLREFLNEAINHKPFQDFLSELKDPDAKAKGSLFRRIVNAILKLIRGGDVASDSILQRSFELSLDLANYTDRELPTAERTKTQAEYFKNLEARRGRSLTPQEATNAAVDFAFKYPQPRIANTRAEASRLAPQVLTAPELEGFLASQAYMGVSDQQVYDAIKANGGITIDVWTAGQPGTGIVVAPFKETETKIPLNEFKPDDVNSFMEKFRPLLEVSGMHLGGWISDDTVYLDVSVVTEDEVTATLLAQDGNQLATFNIGTGEFPSTPELVARNSGALAERRSGPDFQNLARTLQQAFGRAMGGIQGADTRNVPAEGAFPELGVIEALTGEPITQNELGALQESAERMEAGPVPTRAEIRPSRPNAEPNPFVKNGIREYNSRYGIAPAIEGHYAPVNEQRARDIAAAYEALPIFDKGRETQEAYAKLAEEIQQQWGYAINEMGVTFEEWSQPGQPYANSRDMVRDVRDNKHLWFFTGGEPHPLLNQPDADGLTINDKLRAIHDLFGHAADDYQFGARGEENAWIKHSQMFSPLAQKALTTETRGQNSWVNFGPQNYDADGSKKTIPAAERPFAVQKVALLPEEFMNWEGALSSTLASKKVGPEQYLSSATDEVYDFPAPSEYFPNAEAVRAYVEKKFKPPVKALNSWVNDNLLAREAAYVVVGQQGRHYIEFNPYAMTQNTRTEVDAVMREELVHCATGLVLQRKGIEWQDFYEDLGSSLSPQQRERLKGVYRSTRNNVDVGAEYFRAAIQQLLYGRITEAERKTSPMKKILSLIMDFVNYFRKGEVDPVVREVYEDSIRILQKVDKKNVKQDVLFSSAVPEELGRLWQEAAAKEGGDAFAYGEVAPEVKSFSDVFKSVLGDPSKNFPIGYYNDGNDVTAEEWETLTSNKQPSELWVKDPNKGVTVFFSDKDSAPVGIYAVNSTGTKTQGSALYQAFYAWAHNNGKIVGPDSSLSKIGQLRRTSQMFSSALRFGTTKHIRPSYEQEIKGWRYVEADSEGQYWEISNELRPGKTVEDLFKNPYNRFNQEVGIAEFYEPTDGANDPGVYRSNWEGYSLTARRVTPEEAKQAWTQNIGLLANKESQLVFERIPELKRLRISKDGYLFGPDEDYPGSTQALPAGNTNEYLGTLLSAISKADPEFAARVGPATLARALATRFSETNSTNPTLLSSDAEGSSPSGQLQLNTFSPYTKSLYSAPVPFQGNVTPGFNPTVYTAADRRQTTAFTRVLNDPEYQGIRNALGGKQYISYTVDETSSQAEAFLNNPIHNGDLKTAFAAAGNATGVTAEQVVMVKALAIQRAQKAANSARLSSGDTALPASTRNSMDTLARHYQDLADEFADDLMSQASLAGQELRAFRMLADSLSPYSWVRKYKQPIVHTQKLKMDNDPVFKEMLERIKAARRDAANSTTTRMQKALAIAAKRFVKDTSVEEVGAYEKFARLLASNLSVREEVMQAATEMAVVSGMEAVRKAVAPDEKVDPAFLKQWEDKLRSIASEQLNGIIESRLQGGMVDAEASPELTEEQKESAREQKIMDAWRDFSDFPLAEMVFNLARSTIVASDSPYSALVRKAQFDPAKIKRLQQAVKMSINTAEEIRKSVADRNMSVESLVLRLQEANPSLSETEVGALANAVKAVYDDEVQRASAAALQTIVNISKRDPRKLTDAATISKILPLVNMGAFKEEEVYNTLAENFGLPTWSQENADKIEAMANQVQALPEGSLERGEKGQQMMLEILRANIKDSRGAKRFQHINQIASAIWTAGILSGPPTQIVNAAGTATSVFLETFMDATGHFIEAKKRGVSTSQASEYYKDIARAWLFAFGKDANNTSLRSMNEVYTALTRGASKFKSEKQEDLSTLELFKFDPKVAIPGNALMEAITTGEWKKALPQAGELGLGIARTVSERVANRDAKGALKDYLATLKLVGRGMLATDAVNSFAASAAKEMMIKRTLMQTEGLTDAEVNRQMKEIRKGGEEAVVDAAKAQADQEATEGSFGTTGTAEHNIGKARRVEQLIEQMTYGNSVIEQGRDFAANASFNSEAYGLIGATMMTVFGNINRHAGVIAKPINPFPKTVSNLLNTSLNYTLYGYARAMGWNLGSLAINEDSKYYRAAPDRGSAEFYSAHAKATAGTLALGVLAMMLAQALKDREEKKEPFFEAHGPGPKDPKLRAQWAQSGHKPFTVRIGSLELRYTDWPGLNIPLGMLGTVYDNLVFTNKEADALDQLFIGVASVLGTTLDRNMLGGATALFDLMSKNTYDGAKEMALGKLASSYTGGFLKPSFVRYLETVTTGGYQDARSMRGWFLSQIPVVGALANNPAINVLGEPIKISAWDATAGRLVSQSDTHPILSPLTQADLVIAKPEAYKIYDPSKTTMVRSMSAGEEYEYAATYGKIMKERLTPELVQSLTEQAKFAPQGAQDVLTNIAVGVRNQAQGELAAKRQIQKGKELKGP